MNLGTLLGAPVVLCWGSAIVSLAYGLTMCDLHADELPAIERASELPEGG